MEIDQSFIDESAHAEDCVDQQSSPAIIDETSSRTPW
jgi:hypothetical protein